MPVAKGPTGNALGLSSRKARVSGGIVGKEKGAKPELAAQAPAAPEPARTYPAALLKQAEGRPALDVDAHQYDALWEETQAAMGLAPCTSRI